VAGFFNNFFNMKRICPVCKSEFDGRIDKKFCSDYCRNTFNNQKYQDINNYSRRINRILKQNRKILSDFFNRNITKIHKDKLISAGYNFDYLTNIYKTQKGKEYYYCYDFGYTIIENNLCQIVRKKEYVE